MRRARIACIAQVMHRDVITVPATMRAVDALALMRNERVRHAVVVEGGAVGGVVSERDVMRFEPRIGSTWLVHDVMSAPAVVVAPETCGGALRDKWP